MIDKGFISVHRETLAFALGLKCHGRKNKTEQAADRRHAERQIRAALYEADAEIPASPVDKGHGEPVAKSHDDFWRWLDSAYRDGSQGEEPRFTKYNMEVAYAAGVRAAKAEQPAPVAAPKMCDCNQGRLPCTCKEPAPAEFDKGAALESLAKQIYESWESQPGYLPWVNGGNSLKQDEARRIASRTFELALANQVEE